MERETNEDGFQGLLPLGAYTHLANSTIKSRKLAALEVATHWPKVKKKPKLEDIGKAEIEVHMANILMLNEVRASALQTNSQDLYGLCMFSINNLANQIYAICAQHKIVPPHIVSIR